MRELQAIVVEDHSKLGLQILTQTSETTKLGVASLGNQVFSVLQSTHPKENTNRKLLQLGCPLSSIPPS